VRLDADEHFRTVEDIRADLDLDEALRDAVPPPTCGGRLPPSNGICGAPAVWLLFLSTCGHGVYMCAAHRARLERAQDDPGFSANCGDCRPNRSVDPAEFTWRKI
jgi:hypothetical protein